MKYHYFAMTYKIIHQSDIAINVLLKNAATLSTELAGVRDNYTLWKLEKRIQQADLLILNKLSCISFNRYQSELLFKVVLECIEKARRQTASSLFCIIRYRPISLKYSVNAWRTEEHDVRL